MNPLLDLGARPVIGHRGAAGLAPENTMAGFRLAAELGVDAFELDVQLTADGAPVVLHDDTLDRTTDRAGPVAALTLGELRAADAGARFSPDGGRTFPFRGRDVRVPTLGEVLWAFPAMPVLVELKHAAAQEAVRRVLEQEGAIERCVLAAADPAALEAFRDPPYACAASGPEIAALYRAVLLRRRPPAPRYRCLSVPERWRGLPVPTAGFIRMAGALGCPVHVWTVDRPSAARRYWGRGACGMVTNVPGVIREGRKD
ncbi:MAG TPA: glycerophosphodiester phosphodiesterase family protein [Gemmatimonadales bacterium]|nr:glycerophosphodiester phosphodiesterase family protein [Gemmatimonadales bacterium]